MIGKGVFLLVFVFLLMMYILVATTNSIFIIQHQAGLQALQGRVEVRKKGASEWRQIQGSSWVTTGDRVRTGPAGQAELRWIGPTRVLMEPGTTLQVNRAVLNRLNHHPTSAFYLDQGKIWVRVAPRLEAPGQLRVLTPAATVAVKGTIFSVSVDRQEQARTEETQVEVFQGQVEVLGKQGRQRHFWLQAPQRIVVSPQIFYPLATRLGPADLKAWKRQEVLKPYLQVPWTSLPQRTYQRRLTLSGETEPQVVVTVNRHPVRVHPQGTFSMTINLKPGANPVEIIARDPHGYTSRVKREVVCLSRAAGDAAGGTKKPPG